MNKNPKISVLMPIFNEEDYIIEAIKSVINQTFKEFELIVIDNGSSDKSVQLIEEKISDNRVNLVQINEKGKNLAFNKGYEISNGDWIILLAGDDLLPVDSLKSRYREVKNYNPFEKNIFACGKYKSFSNLKKFNNIVVPKNKKKGIFTGGTIIFSKNIANKIFPIPLELPNEDTWIHLFEKYLGDKLFHISEIVLYYRIHKNNSQSRFVNYSKKSNMMHERKKAYDIFLNNFGKRLSKKNKQNIKFQIKAENYRYNKKILKLIFANGLTLREKIKNIFYSNKLLYKIKIKFFSFFVGR